MDIDADGVVEFTRDLVRIPSTADRGEAVAAELVAGKMREFGWDPIVTEVAPGRPNVVAVVDGGEAGPTLLFEGHTDVVTEGDVSEWTHPPYDGHVVDGRLYGRGAADMKSGLAAILYGARAFQLSGAFPGRVVVAALVDEEGMMLGAKQFAAEPLADTVDAAIIAEPEGGEICPVAKGALRLRIDLHGVMAHGAMPEQGRNPVLAATGFLAELRTLQGDLQQSCGRHEHLGDVYLTPTVVHAGSVPQLNVIPSLCTVGVDIRTIPGIDHDELTRRITTVADDAGAAVGVRAEVSVIDDRPVVDTPSDHPVVRALADAHVRVHGAPAPLGGVPGATDGTILTRDAGIPTVVYGPGDKWIAHQADEYVELAELVTYTEVYAEAADRFLRR